MRLVETGYEAGGDWGGDRVRGWWRLGMRLGETGYEARGDWV